MDQQKVTNVSVKLYRFIKDFNALDYFLTAIIIKHLFGEINGPNVDKQDDFIDWFIADPSSGMSFGRKKELALKILNEHYKTIWDPHKKVITPKLLTNLSKHRNLIAHSHFLWRDQKSEAGVKIRSLRSEFRDTEYMTTIPFNKHDKLQKNLNDVLAELKPLYKKLGLL